MILQFFDASNCQSVRFLVYLITHCCSFIVLLLYYYYYVVEFFIDVQPNPFFSCSPHTGWQYYESGVQKIPTACITIEDAELMARLASRGVQIVVSLNMGAIQHPDADSFNTVAEIVGSKYPEQVCDQAYNTEASSHLSRDIWVWIFCATVVCVLFDKKMLHATFTCPIGYHICFENIKIWPFTHNCSMVLYNLWFVPSHNTAPIEVWGLRDLEHGPMTGNNHSFSHSLVSVNSPQSVDK